MTTKESLQQYFSSFGDVEEVTYPVTKLTNRGFGYAFVLFKDKSAVDSVLGCSHVFQGRTLSVRKAEPYVQRTGARTKIAFIRKVSPSTSKEQIVQHFSKFGRVVKVDLPLDTKENQRLDYCFVHFSSPEELDTAIKDRAQILNSQTVDVQKSVSRTFSERTNTIVAYPPLNATVELTKQQFTQFGAILSIAIKFCFTSAGAPPRPVAIITYKDESSAERAAMQNNLSIDGSELVVYKASPHVRPTSAFQRKLFVEDLPPGVTEAQIVHSFGQFGFIRSVVIVKNPETKELLNWCMVTFKSDGAIDKVLRERQHFVGNKEVKVRKTGWKAPCASAVKELQHEQSHSI